MNQPVRNLVVAIGAFASGKTEFLKQLRQELEKRGTPLHEKNLLDGDFIIEAIMKDDEIKDDEGRGGFNHDHPWCRGQRGHVHVPDDPERAGPTPFTALSDEITNSTIKKTFEAMLRAPEDRIVLVELGMGGRNTNSGSEVDLSCWRIAKLLEKGALPVAALERALLVAHPETSWEGRIQRNEQRRGLTYADETVRRGEASWYIPPEGLQITGQKDDFFWSLHPVLIDTRVRFIHQFSNEPGRDELSSVIKEAAEDVSRWWRHNVEGKVVGENTPRAPERV